MRRAFGAGYDFPVWKAYVQPVEEGWTVNIRRILYPKYAWLHAAGRDCPTCGLRMMIEDNEHVFCPAGCDSRTIPAHHDGKTYRSARHLPPSLDGAHVDQRGHFDSHEPTAVIAEALEDARQLAGERNSEELAHYEHTQKLRQLQADLHQDEAGARRAGELWLAIKWPEDERHTVTAPAQGPRVVICGFSSVDENLDLLGSREGRQGDYQPQDGTVDVEYWPLTYPSSLQAYQGEEGRRQDEINIQTAQARFQLYLDRLAIRRAEHRGELGFNVEERQAHRLTAAALNTGA